jgi:polyferredoxin
MLKKIFFLLRTGTKFAFEKNKIHRINHILEYPMNRTVIAPVFVLFGLIVSVALMAGSSVFTPLVRFIHSGAITPLQAGGCLVFTVAGFAAYYFLLNLLCSYFVPRIQTNGGGSGVTLQLKANGGNQASGR